MANYIMALDAGTTSSRCIIFNKKGEIISVAQKEFRQIFPRAGWVEHDPLEIWNTQYEVMQKAMEKAGLTAENIAGIGITNQRETTIVWDKETGEPIYNAIVWQCRRTAERIDRLKSEEAEDDICDYIREKTGLVADPYFSASKIEWILEKVPGAREKAEAGRLIFGTVDTWLIWNLTRGGSGEPVHVTDVTNASRTMLFDIHSCRWDERLLGEFHVPCTMLPRVAQSSEIVGRCAVKGFEGVPISGIAGDQQAALFGQCCFEKGDVKNTYGTGCFMLMNTGAEPISSNNGLVTTIACGIDGQITYALEGSVFIAGAAIKWLRDEMKLIEKPSECEKYCREVSDTDGIYVVPAFSGLGAPYWNPYARGMVVGLTRGTSKAHFIRATVESLAYQVYDLIHAMEADAKSEITSLKVDGGASANDFMLEFQADILDRKIERPTCLETTALGAAYLAGLAVGYWKDKEEIVENRAIDKVFVANMSANERETLLAGWKKAVDCAMYFANGG